MTRLLFLGLNFAPEDIGIGLYSGELIEGWTAAGNAATVVTAPPYYPQWQVREGFGGGWREERMLGADVIRCPLYVPASPTGFKRVLHHLSFAASSLFPTIAAALRKRPALVMTVAPSLVAAPVAWLAAKLSGARSWLHIQDFEVEAASATGLVSHDSVGLRLAASFERWLLARFDVVSTISPQMCAKLAAKGVPDDRIVQLRNWADLDAVRPASGPSPYRDCWGISTSHVALYSGNIANKQGIEIVLDAARLLSHRSDLTFVICGEGPNRANLECEAAGLANVVLRDLQPREHLSDLLALATLHLLPQRAGAADLVLPSKLTNMLASGRPVVATAVPGTGLSEEVDGVGLVTPPGDAQAFAAAIEGLLDDPAAINHLGLRARARAEDRWSRTAILGKFFERAQVGNDVAPTFPSANVSG